MTFGVRVRVFFGVGKVVESAEGCGRKAVIGAHNSVEQAAGVLRAVAGFGVVDSQADAIYRAEKVEADSSVEARADLLWTPRHDRTGAVMDSRILLVRTADTGIIMRTAVTWTVRMDW